MPSSTIDGSLAAGVAGKASPNSDDSDESTVVNDHVDGSPSALPARSAASNTLAV